MGRELLMYRTVKLKIFFGKFDCDTDHTFVNWERAYFVTLLKKRALATELVIKFIFLSGTKVLKDLLGGTINVVLNIRASTS